MLSNLIYSLNAIVPIVVLVIVGIVLKRIGLINDTFISVSEKLVFRVALPVMLFTEVSESDISQTFNAKLIAFIIIAVSGCFLLFSVCTPLLLKNRGSCGSFIQGVCRSNFAILGVPLAENLFGDEGIAAVAIAMPFVILMFNTYSVIVLSVFSDDNDTKITKATFVKILKNIATNPLIIGIVCALPFMLTGFELPVIATKSLGYIKNLVTPLALIALGGNFKFESLKGKIRCAVTATVFKTMVIPAFMVTMAALIGLRGVSLGVVLVLFGAPTAVASYIMAKNMHNDHELAAQIVLLTTLTCAFTIFAGVFILKTLELI